MMETTGKITCQKMIMNVILFKILPVQITKRIESPIPAWATTHPDRRKMMTPNMLIITEVKTPSHMPKRTGCDMKNCDFHHGFSPCNADKH
jgi:hypothetical protein